jgi:hypothetical protein
MPRLAQNYARNIINASQREEPASKVKIKPLRPGKSSAKIGKA